MKREATEGTLHTIYRSVTAADPVALRRFNSSMRAKEVMERSKEACLALSAVVVDVPLPQE